MQLKRQVSVKWPCKTMDMIWALDCPTQETNSPAVSPCSAVWPLSVWARELCYEGQLEEESQNLPANHVDFLCII